MKSPKSLDIDPEVQALLDKAEKLQRDHMLWLGKLVVETGAHKALDADQLRAVLVAARDAKLAANATGAGGGGEVGAAGATFPAKAAAKAGGRAEPEPNRPRHPDLLARPEEP